MKMILENQTSLLHWISSQNAVIIEKTSGETRKNIISSEFNHNIIK